MFFFGETVGRTRKTPTLRDGHAKDGAPASAPGVPGFVFGRRRTRRVSAGEEGYVLLAVVFLAVMILILLAVAAPKVAADIERDREVELMHRGLQYRRAIQLYYRKFGAYPPNMESLEKMNQIRFLRRRYKDPVTGKDEWHLIHFGENKTPTTLGFFGQPLGGTGIGGTGAGCGGQSVGAVTTSSFGGSSGSSSFGGSGSFGGSSSGSGFGSTSFGGNSAGGASGCGTGDNSGLNGNASGGGLGGAVGTTDPNAANASGTGSSGTGSDGSGNNGSGSNGATTAGGTSSINGAGTASTFGGSTLGGGGQTFGGGGIIGVESTSPKATILEYKKKKHFNEWEFVYDPIAERLTVSSNLGAVGQPMSGAGNSTSPAVNSPSLNNSGQPPASVAPSGSSPSPQ